MSLLIGIAIRFATNSQSDWFAWLMKCVLWDAVPQCTLHAPGVQTQPNATVGHEIYELMFAAGLPHSWEVSVRARPAWW